jgi:hypothetical protein
MRRSLDRSRRAAHNTEAQDTRAAPALAASIFLDVPNVFLLLLNLFNRD